MKSFPNSRLITVNKEQVKKNSTRFYLCAYTDNLSEAMKLLTGTEFKLYIALLFNRNGYSFTFSPEYLTELTGMCLDSCRKAFSKLIEKGFIVAINKAKSKFNFYETRELAKSSIKKYITDTSTGEVYLMTYNDLVRLAGFNANNLWQNGVEYYE